MPARTINGVPIVDFSPLGELASVYNQGRIRAARNSLADLAPGGRIDPNVAAQTLLAAGDIEGARQVADLGQVGGALSLARERFAYEKAQNIRAGEEQRRALEEYSRRTGSPAAMGPSAEDGEAVKGSWYSQYDGANKWVDTQDRPGSNALGVPDEKQGIAMPSPSTLGQWFDVTAPNGQTYRLQQTDVGPARWTGRGVDISAAAADKMGYTPGNFPTGGRFTVRPASGPPEAAPVAAGTAPAAPSAQPSAQAQFAQEPQITSPVQLAQQGAVPQGMVGPAQPAPAPGPAPDDPDTLRWVMGNEKLPAGLRKEAQIRLQAMVGAQYGQRRETPEEGGQRAVLEARGKASVEAENESRKSANAAHKQLDKLSLVAALADRLETGATFPTNIRITALAKDLNIPDSWAKQFNLKPDQLADAETLRSLVNELVVGKLGPGGFPSAQFSDTDRKFLEETAPSLGNDPGSVRLKVEIARRTARLETQRQDDWVRFHRDNPRASYFDFEDQWTRDRNNRDIFGDLQRDAQALIGQPKTGRVPGAAPQGAPSAPPQGGVIQWERGPDGVPRRVGP